MNILFDFDGTLFDSYPNIVENIYREISEERKHIISREEVYKLVKVNAKFAMDMLEFNESQRERVYKRQYEVVPELNKPFPHIEKVLQSSKLNVIMTHKSANAVNEILKHYKMDHYFEEIITKDSGFAKKPNPESYIYLNDKYNIDLAVGDRQLDLLPAKEIGIATCSYQNHLPSADYYIDDYANFPLVVLGMKYGVKSHSKKRPELNPDWLGGLLGVGSAVYKDTLRLSEEAPDRDVAYLHKIGMAQSLYKTGYYPLDGALFALEHGFKASTIKTVLMHHDYNIGSYGINKETKELYELFNFFMTDYVEEKNKKIYRLIISMRALVVVSSSFYFYALSV